jgi:hypothetical protein
MLPPKVDVIAEDPRFPKGPVAMSVAIMAGLRFGTFATMFLVLMLSRDPR